jgi:hypothetical protein
MPIAPLPDPLPDNSYYNFSVTLPATENYAGITFSMRWEPWRTGADAPEERDAAFQALVDHLAAFPGAEVYADKSRVTSQEITPTEA